MEVVLGALPSVLPKLGELLADEYNLQKEVKGGIIFLRAELESMKAALEDISKIPADQLPSGDKIWSRNVRELLYDIEDNIDTFMVQVKGHHSAKKHGFKKFIDKTLGSLMQPKIRRKIAVDIREMKRSLIEVHDRRCRYEVNRSVDTPVKVDPHALVALARYKNPAELVGIEETRDEVIKILIQGNEVSKEEKKIVSIVGFGGLGKTTLANAVYERLRAQFDCSAFVSVSQTPDLDRLFKDMFYQLANSSTASINVIDELREFLREKSDGVPLAIITIASLLAGKGRKRLEWYHVCNSIGAGLKENNNVENMRKVLSLSYYDMPCYLRTCLLYLSMFPEDYGIRKDRLIWLWIAEGFIQSVKKDKSLFEIGESYLSDLINKSMIQPTHYAYSGMVVFCRVHDMVLDLICSLSSEENFVTLQNNMGHSSESKKVRRLSLQNGKASHGIPEATLSKEDHVRSVIIFQSAIDYIPTVLENFSILRVLDLEGCDLSQGNNSLKYLGNLLHLRYLSLRDTRIDKLPEEIGNLRFLLMFDVGGQYNYEIHSLPSSIIQLTQLMCLRINKRTIVMEGIVGSLIALEELSSLRIGYKNGPMLEELAHLTELKVLKLEIITDNCLDSESDDGVSKSLVECLNKLQKIQSLQITIEDEDRECNLDGWVVTPENLRILEIMGPCCFATLPVWLKVNPSLLMSLSFLEIGVKRLQQEDLVIVGRLPALRALDLTADHEDQGIIPGRLVVGACSFPCLVRCCLWGFGGPVVFEQGAMPRLVVLMFQLPVQRTREINGSFELGLGNLLSLRGVFLWLEYRGATKEEVEEAKAAVRHAIEVVHPNHPKLTIEEED